MSDKTKHRDHSSPDGGVEAAEPAPEPAPAPAAAPAPDAGSAAEPKTEDYLRMLQRERADFANYRRRVEEERAQLQKEAALSIILRLLVVVDDFERALASATPEELETSWGKGVQLVERKLRALLAAEELERIDAEGVEFSPWEHEAIGHQPSPDVAEGRVLHVVRPGYRKGERIIRPAQVVVARRPD